MENEIKDEFTENDELRDALETAIKARNVAKNALRIIEKRFIACTTSGVFIPFEIFDIINNYEDRDVGAIMKCLAMYCDDYSQGMGVGIEQFMDPDDPCFAFCSLLTKMVL